ncbi:MAG: hypothetical protein MUE41_17280 [Gemmatimonadaceae bacterium]|jgi:hypothetical protein|nr:hypothetical protein [Gemmatimonadaceae bacterium]
MTTPPGPDDAPDDIGAPIDELRGFALSLDAGFAQRVERRVERRRLTSEVVGLSVLAPVTVFFARMRIPFEWLAERRPPPPPTERS